VLASWATLTTIYILGNVDHVMVPIDEYSHQRILNCIQTLSELETIPAIHEIFLKDTQAAYTKILGVQEVNFLILL
jgi:coatomer subunit beta